MLLNKHSPQSLQLSCFDTHTTKLFIRSAWERGLLKSWRCMLLTLCVLSIQRSLLSIYMLGTVVLCGTLIRSLVRPSTRLCSRIVWLVWEIDLKLWQIMQCHSVQCRQGFREHYILLRSVRNSLRLWDVHRARVVRFTGRSTFLFYLVWLELLCSFNFIHKRVRKNKLSASIKH